MRRHVWVAGIAMVAILLGVWLRLRSFNEADADVLLKFKPPTAKERQAAIGDLRKLSPALQRVFDPGDDFAPIAEPGPSDWLAKHHEGGQTFDQFVQALPNRPNKDRHTIYLQPLGEFAGPQATQLEPLRDFTSAYFTLETKLLPTLMLADDQVTSRINSNTNKPQWLTGDLLQLLEQRLPEDAYCLLGITLTDLYPSPDWNYVFGQATLRKRVGVYSFARFDPAFFDDPRPRDVDTLILRRSCGTLSHETCHMFGIQHCTFFNCVVNGSNNLAESDSRPLHACPVCLRKLHESIGFDPLQRDDQLLAVHRRLGLNDEAAWLEQRLKRLRSGEVGKRTPKKPPD